MGSSLYKQWVAHVALVSNIAPFGNVGYTVGLRGIHAICKSAALLPHFYNCFSLQVCPVRVN